MNKKVINDILSNESEILSDEYKSELDEKLMNIEINELLDEIYS